MQFTVPPDIESLINKRLSSGSYASAEDVLRRALQAQDAEENLTEEERRLISAHIEVGYAQAERGETTDGGQRRTMAKPQTELAIDWMACELIEQVSGKVSGRPIVRGTRILPDAIVDSYDLGETMDALREGFPSLSVAQMERLIEFAHAQRRRL